jgi:hypothetical protein
VECAGIKAMATASAQPTQAPASNGRDAQTTFGLVGHLLDEVTLLFRQEVRLATAEVSRSLTTLVTGTTSVAVAGAVLFAGLLLLLTAAVLALALAMPAWLAALIVGAVATLCGAGLLIAGRTRFRETSIKAAVARSAESLSKDSAVLSGKSR